jgi:8-oxo-dGTP diphosphatase
MKVTAAVIEHDGKILIAKRKPGDRLAGKWEFPGGKIEPGETPEECLRRELREELGVETEVGEFLGAFVHKYEDFTIELLAYRVARISGEYRLHDHEAIDWIAPSEADAYDFAAADLPIVARLRDHRNA